MTSKMKDATRLILVRHGEAEGNITRRFHGQHDSALTENGLRQIACLRNRFADIPLDAIYSSDLRRARMTAEAVLGDRPLKLIFDQRLREINGGAWEDRPWDDLAVYFKESFANWNDNPHLLQIPEGESMQQVADRMQKSIEDILSSNSGKVVAAASHGTAIKAWMSLFRYGSLKGFNEVPWYDNTAVTVIDFTPDGCGSIVLENDISHLKEGMSTFAKQNWWKMKPEGNKT